MHYLAVYGTLKRPYGNHALIRDANLPFVMEAVTKDASFAMLGGGFPYVHEGYDGQGEQICVELYSWETLTSIRNIDRLEGHPSWYCRKEFPFITSSGEEVTAWMYVQPHKEDIQDTIGYVDPTVQRRGGIAEWVR